MTETDPDPAASALTLPALTRPPRRLLVFLHGAGSRPGAIVSAALAWQLRLRSAQALLVAGPHVAADGRRFWADPLHYPVSADAIRSAADALRPRIAARRVRLGLDAGAVCLVGFSQGASVALELAFGPTPVAGLVIGYAPRLYRLPTAADRILASVHLLHGMLDSVVPAAHGETAYRRLRALGADVSLDLMPDEGHSIGQRQINLGTQRAMDWVFERSQRPPDGAGH